MKREFAIYAKPLCELRGGKFVHFTQDEEVRVMARAEGYALVRLKGCMPFVAIEEHLRPLASTKTAPATSTKGEG